MGKVILDRQEEVNLEELGINNLYLKLDYVARKYNIGCDKPNLLHKPGFYNRQVRAYLDRVIFNYDKFEQVLSNIYVDLEYAFVTSGNTINRQALREWKDLLKQYLFYDNEE